MSETILIVDDNIDNLAVAQILLEGEGFEVQTAEDAAQAIASLVVSVPALILMDIQLPGMDGMDLTRKLRHTPLFENVPIVALSAYAMKSDEEIARVAGCQGYITKPINTRTFVSEVRGYLDAQKTGED